MNDIVIITIQTRLKCYDKNIYTGSLDKDLSTELQYQKAYPNDTI